MAREHNLGSALQAVVAAAASTTDNGFQNNPRCRVSRAAAADASKPRSLDFASVLQPLVPFVIHFGTCSWLVWSHKWRNRSSDHCASAPHLACVRRARGAAVDALAGMLLQGLPTELQAQIALFAGVHNNGGVRTKLGDMLSLRCVSKASLEAVGRAAHNHPSCVQVRFEDEHYKATLCALFRPTAACLAAVVESLATGGPTADPTTT